MYAYIITSVRASIYPSSPVPLLQHTRIPCFVSTPSQVTLWSTNVAKPDMRSKKGYYHLSTHAKPTSPSIHPSVSLPITCPTVYSPPPNHSRLTLDHTRLANQKTNERERKRLRKKERIYRDVHGKSRLSIYLALRTLNHEGACMYILHVEIKAGEKSAHHHTI